MKKFKPRLPGRSEAERLIIAGAGPVCLSAAIYLASRAVPVTVLEAGPQLGRDLRASTFHPPTPDVARQERGGIIV